MGGHYRNTSATPTAADQGLSRRYLLAPNKLAPSPASFVPIQQLASGFICTVIALNIHATLGCWESSPKSICAEMSVRSSRSQIILKSREANMTPCRICPSYRKMIARNQVVVLTLQDFTNISLKHFVKHAAKFYQICKRIKIQSVWGKARTNEHQMYQLRAISMENEQHAEAKLRKLFFRRLQKLVERSSQTLIVS